MIAAIIMVVFPFSMIFAALSDVFTMTIGNRISAVLIGAFLVVAPFIGLSWAEFGWHVAAFALVLAVTFALFATGTMGGGDAKLLASTSLWMGLGPSLLDYLLWATVWGGIFTLFLVFFRKSSLAVYAGEIPILRRMIDERDVPYGVALAIGGLIAFPQSPAMTWALAQVAG
ncbi:A24 family peptidase [Oricola thermophila]|uniref:Prepilin peptidase n=1 Tax=Oricola thermophila TaxID=2742145 RepID=A0A6N1VEU5_9HYPH|nr:prepilin peptidase [Oricola thermophila]QKV19471.1 prepilin peptidase [Oricola thermophila]